MDASWRFLGARLSGRALRFLVERGLRPEAVLGFDGATRKDLGLDARALAAVRAALRAGEPAGAPPELPRGARLVCAADPDYPGGFFRLEAAPAALWVRGTLTGEAVRRVALVGARRATRNGKAFARELAAGLAAHGVEVWSGLARGIDGEAHWGALGGGRTVAVLGCGLDVVYPPEHGPLMERVCAGGAALTEFPPGTQPLPPYFPQRNRLLAAAAEVLLVVEAGEKSGALTTVNWALQLDTPVLVAPGDPGAESCRGSNELLRAGATPLLDASDVLAALGGTGGSRRTLREVARGAEAPRSPGPAGDPHPLLRALRAQPLHVEELASLWPGPGQVQAELVRLELEGLVEALGQGFYAAPGGRRRP